jgi:hypothetical protein
MNRDAFRNDRLKDLDVIPSGGPGRNLVAVGVAVLALGIFDGTEAWSISPAEACRVWQDEARQTIRGFRYRVIATDATGKQFVYEGYDDRRAAPELERQRPAGCDYPELVDRGFYEVEGS